MIHRQQVDSDCNRFLPCRWPPIGKGFSKGAVTLAGDAAHPMTPNLGQGGCTALEVSYLPYMYSTYIQLWPCRSVLSVV